MKSLNKKDLDKIKEYGLSELVIEHQYNMLSNGVTPIVITNPATINNGIKQLEDHVCDSYIQLFETAKKNIDITWFIPASGAASRMFKSFYQFLEQGTIDKDVELFKAHFRDFAFYSLIAEDENTDYKTAIRNMVETAKLAELPKALIPFHRDANEVRRALEEHLVDAAYIIGKNNTVNIHFTISQNHQAKFNELLSAVQEKYSQRFNVSYKVNFSYQSPATDTIALNSENELFRDEKGEIVFRPGGHGSLLLNLNELNSDLIFIKNIDNVQPEHLKKDSIKYKKVLAGILIELQNKIADSLHELDNNKAHDIEKVLAFIQQELGLSFNKDFFKADEIKQKHELRNILNRPIRICGMVKNEGAPGGGPFWVSKAGSTSLQIVESSQIDLSNQQQATHFNKATHFNPVDLVCWVKDYKRKKFNLNNFIDADTAFITSKSQNGKEMKVLEHPGLWNGAMANWITIFVEVPIATFSPVKTVTDLLQPNHQPV